MSIVGIAVRTTTPVVEILWKPPVGTTVVAVFGPTNEHQTAPLAASPDQPPARLALHPVWCRPCMLRECPLGRACMLGVASADVAALIP